MTVIRIHSKTDPSTGVTAYCFSVTDEQVSPRLPLTTPAVLCRNQDPLVVCNSLVLAGLEFAKAVTYRGVHLVLDVPEATSWKCPDAPTKVLSREVNLLGVSYRSRGVDPRDTEADIRLDAELSRWRPKPKSVDPVIAEVNQ